MAIPRKKPFQIVTNEGPRAEGLPWQAFGVSVNNLSAQWLDLGNQRFIGPTSRGTFALDGDQVATFKWNSPPGVIQPVGSVGQIATLVYTDQPLPDAGGPILGTQIAATAMLERFALGSLPALGNPGRLVSLTDFDRSIWIDDGTQWRSINGRTFDITAFGAKADNGVTDNGPAIAACFSACAAAGGGEIVSPPGDAVGDYYGVSTLINLDNIRVGIRVKTGHGTATSSEWRWLGAAGSGSMIRFDSAASISFVGLTFSYSNAAYDGDLVKGSHSGTGVDIAGMVWDACEFIGKGATGARTLLSLSAIIICKIKHCAFNGAVIAIRLGDPAYGAGTIYSDTIKFEDNTYNNVTRGVRLGGSNFITVFDGETFEPTAAGTASGVDTDPAAAGQILGFDFKNCWLGDVNATGGGQWLSLTAPANRGISINGNQFDTIRDGEFAIVLGVGAGADIAGNAFIRVAGGTTGQSVSFTTAYFNGIDYHGNYDGTDGPVGIVNTIDYNSRGLSQAQETTYLHHFRYEPVNTLAINPVNVGTGAITAFAGGRGQLMATGVTNPSSCSQKIVLSNSGAAHSIIGRVRRIALDCYLADTLANSRVYYYLTDENVNVAPSATARHLGIKNLNGTCYFTTADGAVEQTTDITAFIVAATEQQFKIVYDLTTARLYINGVLRATHITSVPGAGGPAVFHIFIDNNASANARQTAFYCVDVDMDDK